MIPSVIEKEHILQAIRQIGHDGVPVRRHSSDYCLVYESRHYPPKYTIALAHEIATGRLLPSDGFSGGPESNNFLQTRGFEVVACDCGGVFTVGEHQPCDINRPSSTQPNQQTTHSERCPECKVRVRQLLERIYGTCIPSYRLGWPAQLLAYRATSVFDHLEKTLRGLEGFRGHRHFVKSESIPPSDFFVPQPGFIVEFDESQHFTAPRKIALSSYTSDSSVGFSVARWISLCETHNTKDNDPPYRDEQRAWYDTLRDMIPTLYGMHPTVRLYAGDYPWCSLSPDKVTDVEYFKSLIGGSMKNRTIDFEPEQGATIARIVLTGQWQSNLLEASELLTKICQCWPMGNKVKYLITCGGFLEFPWPLAPVTSRASPQTDQMNRLQAAAEKHCAELLNNQLREKLKKFSRYLTLGVDLFQESDNLRQPHVELVGLVDLERNKWHWTGKSYPITEQETGLIRETDLKTHFVELEGERLMVLGCHDLNMFSHRTQAVTKGWRNSLIRAFCDLAQSKSPTLVLHHPYFTDSANVWKTALGGLKKSLQTVSEFSSAGRWYRTGITGFPEPQRSSLKKVLRATKIGKTIDIVVH